MLGIRSPPGKRSECASMLQSQSETQYVALTEGEFDLIAIAGFPSMKHVSSFLKAVYAITGISNCSVIHVLDEARL